MPRVEIEGFDGLQPRTSPTLLADNQAQQADNVKLYSQELRYWRGPVFDYAPAMTNIKSLYRLRSASDSRWLTWQTDVDVVPGPLADTSEFRVYYTGDGAPKKTNWALASTGAGPYPTAWQYLGVPAPAAAPTVAVTGTGSGTAESRVYVYTYVNGFGDLEEEGPPSPASALVNVQPGQAVTVNGFSAPPTTGYDIIGVNIYRSVAGTETTSYEFVARVGPSGGTFSDNLTVAQLGEALGTIGMIPPPAGLAGLVSLPCGALAGFVGNTVYFSEVYKPHAWPIAYALSVPRNIVGLAVYGNSVVACTDGEPYLLQGPAPGGMQVVKIPLMEPCVSKRSIVSDQYGCTYASPNGLVNISDQIREVVTKDLFRRDEWQKITPEHLNAVIYDGKYFGSFPDLTFKATTLVINRDDRPKLSYLTWAPLAVFVDATTAEVFFVDAKDGSIYQLDGEGGYALIYEWRSKRFVFPQAVSFSCLKLDAEYAQVIPTDAEAALEENEAIVASGEVEGALDTCPLNAHPLGGSALNASLPTFVQLQLYGDRELRCTLAVDSFDVVRIPPFKCRELEIKLSGNINVRSLLMATSVDELMGR